MHTNCPGPTVMNFVAHQDDDLLFMNPDLLHDIRAGHCVRTVYLTAGDAGRNREYWLSREQGSEAAYGEMAHLKGGWVQRTVRLPGGQFVTVASPRGNDRISLIFMHLPDGNLQGQGFAATRHASLNGLADRRFSRLRTVDGQSGYSAAQLTDALNDLLEAYQPAEVRTQSSYGGLLYKDHSDHLAAGQFTVKAFHEYQDRHAASSGIPLVFYMGYPVREFPSDVSGEDLQAKEAVFAAYSVHDGDVCVPTDACEQNPVYGLYLTREYPNPY
jgi:LmbE family N-acetylglucosaminyl deacetylase